MPHADRSLSIEVPWRTILKLIAAVALVWLWTQLWDIVLVFVVAVLCAIALEPVVEWLVRRGLPRWGATALVTLSLTGLVAGFVWMTWSSLNDQTQFVGQRFGDLEQRALKSLPPWLNRALGGKSPEQLQSQIAPIILHLGQSLLSAVVVVILGFVLTMYLLLEGRRTRDWLMAFVPQDKRSRMERTLAESEEAIFGYVAGNVATSVFATIFVLVVLSILKVPAALLLALIAGLCDFIPVIGFAMSAIPAMVLAATVSQTAAILVLVLYGAYHLAENYLISPWVYGDRLKLSNVAVILAFAVGASLAGVIGALIALPIAAIYPAIERIWLKNELPADTVRQHRAIEKRAG